MIIIIITTHQPLFWELTLLLSIIHQLPSSSHDQPKSHQGHHTSHHEPNGCFLTVLGSVFTMTRNHNYHDLLLLRMFPMTGRPNDWPPTRLSISNHGHLILGSWRNLGVHIILWWTRTIHQQPVHRRSPWHLRCTPDTWEVQGINGWQRPWPWDNNFWSWINDESMVSNG